MRSLLLLDVQGSFNADDGYAASAEASSKIGAIDLIPASIPEDSSMFYLHSKQLLEHRKTDQWLPETRMPLNITTTPNAIDPTTSINAIDTCIDPVGHFTGSGVFLLQGLLPSKSFS